jgi:BlaI family transcriptional regulator, penicillinase repressor
MKWNPAGILTVRELDLMNVLWEHGPQRVREVRSRLVVPLAHTTVQTILHILEMKRCVTHTVDGRAHCFAARVSRAEVARASIRFLKHRLLRQYAASLFELVVDESAHDGGQALRQVRGLVDRRLRRA